MVQGRRKGSFSCIVGYPTGEFFESIPKGQTIKFKKLVSMFLEDKKEKFRQSINQKEEKLLTYGEIDDLLLLNY